MPIPAKQEIELEARLAAIEHLLMHLYAEHLSQGPDPLSAVREMQENWQQGLDIQTIPGLAPEQSDLFVGEIAQQEVRILAGIRELLERRYPPRP